MTILTAGACQFMVTTSGNVIPAAVGSALGAAMTGVKMCILSEPAAVAIGTAVGTSSSLGAVVGAYTTKAATGALTGALVSSMSAAGLGSVVAGSFTAASSGMTASPLGMLAVGTSVGDDGDQPSYDCWKAVVREECREPSSGLLLKDLIAHPCVSKVTSTSGFYLPHIFLENVWRERFEIEYVISKDVLSCHASPVLSLSH